MISSCCCCLFACLLAVVVHALDPQPRMPNGGPCENVRPGDCNPDACDGGESFCEARYTRFWDPVLKVDRSRKSCQCVEQSVCSVIGTQYFTGCRSYMSLNRAGQKLIREWTYSPAEKHLRQQMLRNTSRTFDAYTMDKIRHFQLQNGNTRFCCKTFKKRRRFVSPTFGDKLHSSLSCPLGVTFVTLLTLSLWLLLF